MYLLSLVILFALLGYIFATSSWGRKLDDAVDRAAAPVRRRTRPLADGWNRLFSRTPQHGEFRAWALGVGAAQLPAELKSWLAGLSEEEAHQFHLSLEEYADSLGFKLSDLVDGSLDRDPMMRQVFVETIVVYSPAYRKARQAREKAEVGKKGASPEADRPQAEKAPSRRKEENNGGPVAENHEPAPAA
jgi:hypothetical protein